MSHWSQSPTTNPNSNGPDKNRFKNIYLFIYNKNVRKAKPVLFDFLLLRNDDHDGDDMLCLFLGNSSPSINHMHWTLNTANVWNVYNHTFCMECICVCVHRYDIEKLLSSSSSQIDEQFWPESVWFLILLPYHHHTSSSCRFGCFDCFVCLIPPFFNTRFFSLSSAWRLHNYNMCVYKYNIQHCKQTNVQIALDDDKWLFFVHSYFRL